MKILQHDLRVIFFDDGRCCATLSFAADANYQVEGNGDTQEEAAIDAVSQVFQFAKNQAPHLISEDICS